MKVSVLIPVYGVEKYLQQFLDSLSRQRMPDCEFIIVNDASPDNCDKIISEFIKKEPRVVYINKETNEGEMQARQDAFDIARGEYVINIDSDDYISDDFLDCLYYHAKTNNLDMALSNVMLLDDNTKSLSRHGSFFDKDIVFNDYTISKTLGLPYATWCRLTRKNLLEKYNYSYLSGETSLTKLQYLPCVASGLAHKAVHFYRQRGNSLSALSNTKDKYSEIYSIEKIRRLHSEDSEIFGDTEMTDTFKVFRFVHTLKLILLSSIKNGSFRDFIRSQNELRKLYKFSAFSGVKLILIMGRKDRVFGLFGLFRMTFLILFLYRVRLTK